MEGGQLIKLSYSFRGDIGERIEKLLQEQALSFKIRKFFLTEAQIDG